MPLEGVTEVAGTPSDLGEQKDAGKKDTGWLVKRAGIAYVALAALLTLATKVAIHLPGAKPTDQFPGSSVLGGWCRFDCTWYRDIVDNGYFYTPGRQSSIAFFPGYPLVVRPLARLIDNTELAAFIVTWIAGLVAVLLFAYWCAQKLDRRTATLAVTCLVLYPYGFFLFGAGYADALFLACAIGAFVLLEHDHPILAGVIGAGAAATRPIGIVVAVGLFLRAIELRGGLPLRSQPAAGARLTPRTAMARIGIPARINLRVLRRADLGVLLAPAGLIAWSAWLGARFNDPFAYSTVQVAWDQPEGPHTWFKIGFGGQLLHGNDIGYTSGLVVQALLTLVAIIAVPYIARRLGAAYAGYTLLAVLLSALGTKDFQGVGRYVLSAFPLFVAAAMLLDRQHERVKRLVLALAAVLLVVAAGGFARNWYLT